MSLQPHKVNCPRCSHPMSAKTAAALQAVELEHAAWCTRVQGERE